MSPYLPVSLAAFTTEPFASDTATATAASPWPTTSSLQLVDRQAAEESLPPMTSHWTRPETCTWTYDGDNQLQSTGAVAWLDLKPIPHATTHSCYPDGMFSYGQTGVFSPATCPDNWTTATAKVNTKDDKADETTTVICCSSDYSLDGGFCKRSVPTVLAVPISYNETIGTYSIVTNSTTTLYSATIAVHTIQALFQEKDRALLGLTDDMDISTKPGSKGLSLGAQIGIGIGVTAAVVLILGTVMFLFARRGLKLYGYPNPRPSNRAGPEETGHAAPIHSIGKRHRYNSEEENSRVKGSQAISESSVATGETAAPLSAERRDDSDRDEEIQALRSQQAEIQRRLDQLEKNEADRSQG